MAKTSAAKSQSLYGVHPGVAMVQKWVSELKEKTGRSLDEWITLVKKEGPKGEHERREWLKTKHKLGMNSAWWIAERTEGKGGEEDTPESYLKAAVGYVEEQYAGPKEKLRPPEPLVGAPEVATPRTGIAEVSSMVPATAGVWRSATMPTPHASCSYEAS